MFLDRVQTLGLKTETTQSTAVALSASDHLLVEDPTMDPSAEEMMRNYKRATLSPLASIITKPKFEIGFKTEIKGSGSAGTAYTPLGAALQACGFVETVAATQSIQAIAVTGGGTGYTPGWNALILSGGGGSNGAGYAFVNSSGAITEVVITNPGSGYTTDPTPSVATGSGATFTVTRGGTVMYAPTSVKASSNFLGPGKSATILRNINGFLQTGAGCVGNLKGMGEAGKFCFFEFNFTGKYAEPTDTAIASTSENTTNPPKLESSLLKMQTLDAICSKFAFDMKNSVVERPDTRSVDGLYGFFIGGRDTEGSFDPELETVAGHNFYNRLMNSTTALGHIKIGATAGNITEIIWPAIQYKSLKHGERSTLSVLDVPVRFTGSDNEIIIIQR